MSELSPPLNDRLALTQKKHNKYPIRLLISLGVLFMVLGWAFWPSLFTDIDPLTGNAAQSLRPPSPEHWFGTDHMGRDLYSRTVYGTALSLHATTLAVLVASVAGTLLGIAGGFFGGAIDRALTRVIEVLMAIPSLLLSMAIITALGFGTLNIALAVGLSSIAAFARVTRGEVLRLKTQVFVEAAYTCGVSPLTIIRHHILPHIAGTVMSLAALEFGIAVLSVSALSFLGFGAPPPQPEWGLLVSEGRNYMVAAWWYTTLPGLVIASVVLATNQLARILQDRHGALK